MFRTIAQHKTRLHNFIYALYAQPSFHFSKDHTIELPEIAYKSKRVTIWVLLFSVVIHPNMLGSKSPSAWFAWSAQPDENSSLLLYARTIAHCIYYSV